MKKVFTLAVLAVASLSHASYELMFASDAVGNQIKRFDAISGQYLGAFGAGLFTYPGRTSADPKTGIIYCGDQGGSRIVKFNYSTGEFAGSFGVSGGYHCSLLQDGTIVTGGENQSFFRYSSTGTLLTTYTLPGGKQCTGITQAANGFVYACTFTGEIYRFAATGGASTLVTTLGANQLLGIKAYNNTIGVTSYQDNGYTATFNVDGSGNLTGAIRAATLLTPEANTLRAREVAFGHQGLMYILGEDVTATKNYAYTWDPTMSIYARKLDLGIGGSAFGSLGLSTIVAPEPGSIVAIGLGLAFLARRRKN